MLIANKIDLASQRQVSSDESSAFAKQKNLLYYETSSKTNQDQCVNKAFYALIEETTDQMLKSQEQEDWDLKEMAIR